MKRIDRHQTMILVLGAAILVGFGVFRYIPIVRKKLELKKQMAQQSLSMEEIKEYSRRLPELKLQIKELEGKQSDYLTKIPEGKQFSQLWQQIAEIMNECKLQDQLVQPGAEQKSDDLCCIPLQIECKGTLAQIFEFVQSVEQFDRLVCFEELQLENSDNFSAIVKMNAKVKVYYQPGKVSNS